MMPSMDERRGLGSIAGKLFAALKKKQGKASPLDSLLQQYQAQNFSVMPGTLQAIAPPQVPVPPQEAMGPLLSLPPMVDEAEAMPVEEPESPLAAYRAGSLSLPTRQYDIPNAPTMRGLPALPQRDMGQDSRRGLDAAGVGALAGLLLGGGRGAVAGGLGAGRGYMAGRQNVAAQNRQDYGDQLQQVLRLNSQDQQGYQNAMTGLSRQMQADTAADGNRARVFNANETAGRGAFTANQNATTKREETAIRSKAAEFKRIMDTSKDQRELRKAAADMLLTQARAEKLGFDILDRTAKRNLEEWVKKNQVATAKYNAESNRMAVGNGATYQQGQLSLRGKELGLREREIENKPNVAAQTDMEQAQKELQNLRKEFADIGGEITKLKRELAYGRPEVDANGLATGKTAPLPPAEAQIVQSRIAELQNLKKQLDAGAQPLRLRAGGSLAPYVPSGPLPPPATVGGKLVPPVVKLPKVTPGQVKTKSGNTYTWKPVGK